MPHLFDDADLSRHILKIQGPLAAPQRAAKKRKVTTVDKQQGIVVVWIADSASFNRQARCGQAKQRTTFSCTPVRSRASTSRRGRASFLNGLKVAKNLGRGSAPASSSPKRRDGGPIRTFSTTSDHQRQNISEP
jgi:hypothetical protein